MVSLETKSLSINNKRKAVSVPSTVSSSASTLLLKRVRAGEDSATDVESKIAIGPRELLLQEHPLVPGFYYCPDYITEDEHKRLLAELNGRPWSKDLKRRTQHYRYNYSYKTKTVERLTSPENKDFPPLCQAMATRIEHDPHFKDRVLPADYKWDQMIANEYTPTQGIAKHIDRPDCFGACVASLSLGEACVVDLFHPGTKKTVSVDVQPRSLYILSGPARYTWQHGIEPKKTHVANGKKMLRKAKRISVTYRMVLPSHRAE